VIRRIAFRTRKDVQSFFRTEKGECILARQRYRLRRATLAVHRKGGESAIIAIPEYSIVVLDTTREAKGMVAVEWEGKQVAMFVEDLRARGILLETTPTEGAASAGLTLKARSQPDDKTWR
jgi:hypothetical protein